VPEDFDPTAPTPLVVLLHGFGASGVANDIILGLADEVDARGYVLLRPDGTVGPDGRRFWNATDACCDFNDLGIDDVAYLTSLIEEVQARYTISRVALIGHSNGGYMTHRLACDRASLIDAAAPIAGSTWQDASRCQPDDTVAMLQIHGSEDPDVLFEGETGEQAYPGAVETVARWAGYNGCDAEPKAGPSQDFSRDVEGAETEVTFHPDCDAGGHAELWNIVGETHLPAFTDAWRATVLDHLLGE
jgi:polyhydroxybutyrate depolymerase